MDDGLTGALIGKVWGATTRVFLSDSVQVELLTVKSGYRCSMHHHVSKFNLFYVISGLVRIVVEKDNLQDVIELGPGQKTVIRPNCPHRFEGLADSLLLEIYFLPLAPDDIVRRDQGGPITGEVVDG